MIITKANRFLSKENAENKSEDKSFEGDESGKSMIMVVLTMAVAIMIGILVYVSVQAPLNAQIDATNNTAAATAVDNVDTTFWAVVALLVIAILIIGGKFVMAIMDGM